MRDAQVVTDSICVLADLVFTVLSDTCEPPEGPDAPLWLNILAHLSLAITSLFLAEIPVTLWAMGPKFYNPLGSVPHAGLHLFDSCIILTTFVLEIILRGREQELAGLLIVLRLWRLVKLVGGEFQRSSPLRAQLTRSSIGITVSAGELEEENARVLSETRQERDQALIQLREAQAEIRTLRARLSWPDSDGATVTA